MKSPRFFLIALVVLFAGRGAMRRRGQPGEVALEAPPPPPPPSTQESELPPSGPLIS